MNYYVLFLRNEAIDFGAYSPEDMQQIMAEFDAWNSKMISAGQLLASGSLQGGEGKTLRAGGIIADGPYSEAKEAVAGLLLVRADSLGEATALAAGCPFLPRGGSVEVRLVPQLEFEDAAQPIMLEHAHVRNERMSRSE